MLNVYRTPIGFRDEYVAATRQKAALKAWGSEPICSRVVPQNSSPKTL